MKRNESDLDRFEAWLVYASNGDMELAIAVLKDLALDLGLPGHREAWRLIFRIDSKPSSDSFRKAAQQAFIKHNGAH